MPDRVEICGPVSIAIVYLQNRYRWQLRNPQIRMENLELVTSEWGGQTRIEREQKHTNARQVTACWINKTFNQHCKPKHRAMSQSRTRHPRE